MIPMKKKEITSQQRKFRTKIQKGRPKLRTGRFFDRKLKNEATGVKIRWVGKDGEGDRR